MLRVLCIRVVTTVMVAMVTPQELSTTDVHDYELEVSYKRFGYNEIKLKTRPSDPDCSLLLSHCHLRNLEPGEAYRSQDVKFNLGSKYNTAI
ncbi:hypothetical protein PoB_006561000 [Plakobranchus ocellatus]|uniref:Uncharacterized protein n=1 Tax=Plakobranchus ocellatus TaxID=259542 RepID=A0AAV4D525_9GAST|nr:hypothetical protein PoB_006561000 [Plakobranchus ocellatus]